MKAKLFLVATLLVAVFCISSSVSAMTDSERQSLIQQLQTQIAQLQKQLTQLIQSQQTDTTWCYDFYANLSSGDSNNQVAALQIALTKQGFNVSGDAHGVFGDSTALAVKRFQEKYVSEVLSPYKLKSGTGFMGLTTRAKLNKLYGCTSVVACAQDVKQCSDGSYVGRVAPDCDFADCPAIICTSNWQCGSWSACQNSQQTRTCADSNNCGTSVGKPTINQGCTFICTPNCTNKTCGADNGCGGKCQTGTCPTGGMTCSNGQCVCTNYITANWSCTSWSSCINSKQTRKCSLPTGTCYKVSNSKPSETKNCASTCTPNWQCGDWSVCSSTGTQIRTCADSSSCGVTTGKPATSQSCNSGLPSVKLRISSGGGSDQNSNTGFYSYDSDGPIDAIAGYSQGLKWVTKNATSCTASGDWSGAKAISTMSGARPVAGYQRTGNLSAMPNGSPRQYTFTLTCTGPGGSAQDSVVINVASFAYMYPSPTVTFNADPSLISNGQSTTVTWSSTNTNSCTASGWWSGAKAISGTQTVGPFYATKLPNTEESSLFSKPLTLTCIGSGGEVSKQQTVQIRDLDYYSLSLEVTSSYTGICSVTYPPCAMNGGSFVLKWNSTGATSCTASGDWSGTKLTSGTQTVGPFTLSSGSGEIKEFIITCDGPQGPVSKTVKATVSW